MTDIILCGANGRMGKKVYEASINADGITAVCGIDIKDDFTFSNYPVYASFENVKEKASLITPVPGGVGPMTIAMLLSNTYAVANKE